jgi:hypothetical protein
MSQGEREMVLHQANAIIRGASVAQAWRLWRANLVFTLPPKALITGKALSPFAAKMITALQRLTKECAPHPCGGFTTDDMQWRMGTAFTPDETLWEALDELTAGRLIRHCGDDDDDAIGACYELLPKSKEAA